MNRKCLIFAATWQAIGQASLFVSTCWQLFFGFFLFTPPKKIYREKLGNAPRGFLLFFGTCLKKTPKRVA
jgi:hypothetical protein